MAIQQCIATLALYGFVVNAFGFNGATENRSALHQQLDISLKEVFPELYNDEKDANTTPADREVVSTKKYKQDDLPWSMMVAMRHPTMVAILIFSGGDMPHCVKKHRNNVRLSGMNEHKRNMVLDGKPISLRMLQDVWEHTPDFKDEGSIMLYRKLSKGVFVLNANTLLRSPETMRVFHRAC